MSTKLPSPPSGRPPGVSETRFIHMEWRSCPLRLLEFIDKHPEYLPKENAMQFISDDGGKTYNRCHCKPLLRCDVKNSCSPLRTSSLE